MSRPHRPLEGIRVIALEQYMSAPYCTMLLADSGAEVIKIERPGKGDPRRSIPPFVHGPKGQKRAGGFLAYNRNKKSLALNIRSEKGRELYRELAKKADVIVENLRPGSADKLDIGYNSLKVLNPRLVYAAISGFGRLEGFEGPEKNRPAFDIVAEAMSGIMHLVGFEDKPPSWTIYGLADIYSGLCTAYGIMLALFMRERTGVGQFVDSAMLDNMISLNERMVMLYSVTGEEPHRGRLKHLYPRGAFKCKDGYLTLNVPDDLIWERLCHIMERPDLIRDPRSANGTARASNADFLRPIIENWLQSLSRDEAEQLLNSNGVPVGPVYTAKDLFASPQVAARKMLITMDDPEVGEVRLSRGPVLLSEAPHLKVDPAPKLGEHTRQILTDLLNYDSQQLDQLERDQIIQTTE